MQAQMDGDNESDDLILVITGILLFFLSWGLTLLQCGQVKSRNATNILIMNLTGFSLTVVIYWIIGFAFQFGSGPSFIGLSFFAAVDLPSTFFSLWFFHLFLLVAAMAVVTGALSERCSFGAYVIYVIHFTGVMYPIAARWSTEGKGWLYIEGLRDSANIGAVHLVSGTSSLVATLLLRARFDRFFIGDTRNKGHSIPITAIGSYLAFVGLLGQNVGSVYRSLGSSVKAVAGVNTVLSGSSAALITLVLHRSGLFGTSRKWSFLTTSSGALVGMISVGASCGQMFPRGSFAAGIIGGLLTYCCKHLLMKFKVDDPRDTVAIHFVGGFWGLIAGPLFREGGIAYSGAIGACMELGWNLLGAVCFVSWAAAHTALSLGILKLLGQLRASEEAELRGLDTVLHGESAYPASAWEEEQYYQKQLPRNASGSDLRSSIRWKKSVPRLMCRGCRSVTPSSSGFDEYFAPHIEADNNSLVMSEFYPGRTRFVRF